MDAIQNRLKQLDLLGGLGAGILGAGVALLFAHWLQPYAVPALFIGIVCHGWAMFAKSRLERQADVQLPRWAVAAEWACWVLIAGLLGYIAVIALR